MNGRREKARQGGWNGGFAPYGYYLKDNHLLIEEKEAEKRHSAQQLDLFTDIAAEQVQKEEEDKLLERERKAQLAMLSIRQKYGKNAVLRASSLEEGATAKNRNSQIGGHRA